MTVEDENINEESIYEPSVTEPRVFPGDLLRAAREAKGLSTQEVATYLCLRRQLIEEIDDNKFDPKVAGTFIRGYLKSYAKHVDASEADVLAAYSDLVLEKPSPGNMQSFSRKKAIETQDSRLMLITYIIIAVLVASFVVFLWQQSNSNDAAAEVESSAVMPRADETLKQEIEQPKATNTEQESKANDNPVVEEVAVVETTTASTPVASQTERETENSVPLNEEIEEEVAEEPAAPITNAYVPPVVNRTGTYLDAADPSAGELVLYFLDRSWIEVADANDTTDRLAYGTKEKGYNMPIGGSEAYNITLGAPDAVEVYYRGEPVDLSTLPKNRVGQLRVPSL